MAKSQGKLNFGITAMPQIEGRPNVNLAKYWLQVVSNKSTHKNEAWDFIQYITRADEANKYLAKAQRPPALRSLVDQQNNDEFLKIFSQQLLTSKSWYHGKGPVAVKDVLDDLIDSIHGGAVLEQAILLASQKIQQTY
jgi:ABC-type glycerol-3-phosphate transport system substrate-binding protein